MKTELYYLTISVIGVIFMALIAYSIRYEIICGRAKQKILNMLTTKWVRGRDLRQNLAKDGINLSYGSFYLVMNHLVEEGKASKRDTLDGDGRIREFRLPLTDAETVNYKKDLEQSFIKNKAAFVRQLPELLEKCPGEYVAIIDEEVVATSPEEMPLAKDMSRLYPTRFVFIGHVLQPLKKTTKIPVLASAK
jgi:hypothetical protein